MKDFPVFTTQYGAASLILKEIPYRSEAYIHLRDSLEPEDLLRECVDFCTVCGAQKIYAAGHDYLERFPLHTVIWRMTGTSQMEMEPANLWPVTEKTVSQWRNIYNARMAKVANASTLESRDEKEIVQTGGAYFVHNNGDLLGIGWLKDDTFAAVASVKPGMGKLVCSTVLSVVPGRKIVLEVASANEKAVRLYESLGFVKTGEISRWYRVK